MSGLYRYILFENIRRMEQCGWWVVGNPLGGGHGSFCVLMQAPHCIDE